MSKARRCCSSRRSNPSRDADLAFFDPHTQARLSNPPPAVARAAQIAIAPMRLLSQEATEMSSTASQFDDRDTSNPIIFKPITNRERKVVGVTGMVLDTQYFKDYLLPQLVRTTLPKYFTSEAQENIIVTLHDNAGQIVFATQPFKGQESDIWTGLPYFYDYHLGVRNAYMTPEQWAHWNFNFSLSLAGAADARAARRHRARAAHGLARDEALADEDRLRLQRLARTTHPALFDPRLRRVLKLGRVRESRRCASTASTSRPRAGV